MDGHEITGVVQLYRRSRTEPTPASLDHDALVFTMDTRSADELRADVSSPPFPEDRRDSARLSWLRERL